MRDLKIRPGMDTPKAKLKNSAPKDADSLLKQHMDKRQREKEPESRDPVRYATDRVEKNMRRGASGAADASRRMIKRYQEQKRQGTRIIPMWASLAAGTQTENCSSSTAPADITMWSLLARRALHLSVDQGTTQSKKVLPFL